MKIKRFDNINENLTTDVKQFITDFEANTDFGIIDWIGNVADRTKLNDYKNFIDSSKKTLIFANSKNFKKLTEFILIEDEIAKKEKEVEKLNLKKSNLLIAASDELLYKFQEDLLNKDFNNFYDFFIKDSEEESGYTNIEDIIEHAEIHPKLLKKYRNNILLNITTHKFNI